jgi:superfamily II RNA helicase
MPQNWNWIQPIIAVFQLVIGGLMTALYNSHVAHRKAQDLRLNSVETKQAEHDVKIAKLEGYNTRAVEDRQETKQSLEYLRSRMDELSNQMVKREDMDRLANIITAALKKD